MCYHETDESGYAKTRAGIEIDKDENRYVKAFLRQLKANGISYMTLKTMPNDISEFPMPV